MINKLCAKQLKQYFVDINRQNSYLNSYETRIPSNKLSIYIYI
jgi:hypothetical protein